MRRGELYRVAHPSQRDPKKSRIFVIVSRQVLVDSKFSTVICAPVYTAYDGLSTQVPLGIEEGLKHACSIHCDELISMPKSLLTNFVGSMPPHRIQELDIAMMVALDIGADLD
jgi:mRNA interferase MazF